MSIEREILSYLANQKKSLKYKGLRTTMFMLPNFKYHKYQTLAGKYSGLKKKGYIQDKNGEYVITKEGRKFLNTTHFHFKKFTALKTNKDSKDLLIMYDIPQADTVKRNWFRRELIKFNFIMIQRSVWVGPSPLPDEFIQYVKELKLGDKFKTFKLAKGYTPSN